MPQTEARTVHASLSRRVIQLMLRRKEHGLPDQVMERARLHVLDNVGIALAAHGALPVCDQVLEALCHGGASGNCSVIGNARRLPPALAAFANSALAHALDYDDIHDIARLHPTTVTLPAALAAAECVDAEVETVLEAVALGNELMCRLGAACAPTGEGAGSDWFLTQLFGYLGGCLSACIALNMGEEETVSALGFAYMQLAGGKQAAFGTGATARSIYPAFAAMGGVQAALLSRAGISGPEGALDGEAGMFRLYLGGDPGPGTVARLLDEQAWDWLDTETKPWPCCRLSHPYVAAALALREEVGVPESGRITVRVNSSAGKLCRPIAQRREPETLQDAKYSIPFITAFALAHGRVDLATLNADAAKNEAARALATRIDIEETLPDRPGHPPAEILVNTPQGPHMVRRDAAPVPDVSAVRAKVVDCLRHAGHEADGEALWNRMSAALEGGSARAFLHALPQRPE
jgi:2-methylcitrate dehydratase PrpD